MKLTPLWMFLLLLAILILSVLMGSRVNEEGFTTQTSYSETDLTGYANKVYPIVAGSIFFDKSNGNLVLQADSKVSTIISRGGRETKLSSVVKLESNLSKSIESASTSWSIPIGTTGKLYYIPFGKTTFIQVFNGEKPTGFCFRDSDVFTGEYPPFMETMLNSNKNMLYATLMPVTDNKLTSNKLFKSQLFGIKEAGLFYDIGTGSLVIPKTADSVDIIARDGVRLDDAAINKLKIKTEGPTKNMIDFSLDAKYTLNQNAEFKPWYMFVGSGDAVKTAMANEAAAKKTVDDAAKNLATVKAKKGVTAAEIATAQKALDDANSKLSMATIAKFQTAKLVFVMPYKDNTVITTFDNTSLIGVMRFNKDGYVTPIAVIENTLSEKPSDESAISEYYKWYWYWKKTGAGTMTDDYMLKTQIVPPVCPSCPSTTCPSAPAPVSGAKSEPVSGSDGAKPISDAVKTTGSVAEKAIGTTGDILKSFGSGAKDVGLGTVDLTKSAVTGTVGIAKDVVGGTVGLARDTAGGTVNLVKDAAKGTVGLVKDTAGSAIDLTKDTIKGTVRMANGRNRADSNSWAGRNQPRNWTSASYDNDGGDYNSETMDPYTYNGALKKKATSNFMPVTADFSAFSR